MAINAFVGIRNTDGTVDYIEDERDGEPSGIGIDLYRYGSERAVRALIDFGGVIRVRPVPFDIRPLLRADFKATATDTERWAVGRVYTIPSGKKTFHDVPFDSFTALHGMADWLYLYTPHVGWEVLCNPEVSDDGWLSLSDALADQLNAMPPERRPDILQAAEDAGLRV